MCIDLHIHTTASDGNIDPVTVVKMAFDAGLRTIALADHESTFGYHPARRAGVVYGVKVIPAVEIMTLYQGREVHLLGYFNDPDNSCLQQGLAELRNQRTLCARATVEKLGEFGFKISWNDVKQMAHPDSSVSKGHIMRALYNAGHIKEPADATEILTKYLQRDGLAYVDYAYPFEEAVNFIKDSEGIAILAHPGLIRNDRIVEELCLKDIDGLEVFYYYFGEHRDEYVRRYYKKAQEHRLLKTGGSDYHGTITPVILGENPVPYEEVGEFLTLFGISGINFGGVI